MNLQFLKSFSNGRDVMDIKYPTHFSEIDSVLRLAGLGTPLSEIAKYLLRFKWTALGADQRSFAKGRVKVDLWHDLPSAGVSGAASYDAHVIVALSPALRGLAALNKLAQRANLSSTPTVVVAPFAVGCDGTDDDPEPKRLKTGMSSFLDSSLKNQGVVAALGKLYLLNNNERVTTIGGKEMVTEHSATIYKTAPYSANEKSHTQVNDLNNRNTPGAIRGSIAPEFYPSRQSDVVFLAHGHPPKTRDVPSYPTDFASQRADMRSRGMWSVVVIPGDIYFMGPSLEEYYYLPASDFIEAGKASGTTVSFGGSVP